MIQLSFKFDGGEKVFSRGIDETLETLKSFRTLFELIFKYFEGTNSVSGDKPILEIWKSEGAIIGGHWENQSEYYKIRKRLKWTEWREYDVPFGNETLQIKSGHLYAALTDKGVNGAIREADDRTMVYGVENSYSYIWQESRKILDFYETMITDINRIVAKWIRYRTENYMEWESLAGE